MKKLILSLMLLLCATAICHAVPAYPFPEKIIQPDGTTITVQMWGDEYQNHTTTSDGYTIVKNSAGYYVYAALTDGKLSATSRIARDPQQRTDADRSFLKGVRTHLTPSITGESALMAEASRQMSIHPMLHNQGKYNIDKFRGLIILVEYSDCSFSRSDCKAIFNDMVNKKGYDGYMTDALVPEKITYTGSVRDYYSYNSMGKFNPEFDIVGPVKIGYSKYAAEKSTNGRVLVAAACAAASDSINFAKYDTDADGKVDMVYFIFAGYGSNFTGNDSRLIWPHASTAIGVTYNGKSISRYACSTEMYGLEGSNTLDGIGTICHEFSHVLGLPDEYDTDYEKSNGQSDHPSKWSVMAQGSYLNKSRTPVGYTLYERYSLGFATPETITAPGSFSLTALNKSNTGYRINSPVKNEFFLIENRQQTDWDAYLPGHGMTVMRVDSTNVDIWENNKINTDPTHCYLELLRANPKYSTKGTITDSAGDPFPGEADVREITNRTTPSLCSWTGASSPLIITDIAESIEGTITFTVANAPTNALVEDFETMDVTTTGSPTSATGRFCSWSFTSGAGVADTQDGYGNGKHALAITKKGEASTSDIYYNTTSLQMNIFNPTSSMAIFRCYVSTDGGSSWIPLAATDGLTNITVSAGSTSQVYFQAEYTNPCFKISQVSGNSTSPCYIDDVTIEYESASAIRTVKTNSEAAFTATCTPDGMLSIDSDDNGTGEARVYNASGALVGTFMPGCGSLHLPDHGFYIVAWQGRSAKILY